MSERRWFDNPDPRPRGYVFARHDGAGLRWVTTLSDWKPEYGMRSIRTQGAKGFDTIEEAHAHVATLLAPTEPPC